MRSTARSRTPPFGGVHRVEAVLRLLGVRWLWRSSSRAAFLGAQEFPYLSVASPHLRLTGMSFTHHRGLRSVAPLQGAITRANLRSPSARSHRVDQFVYCVTRGYGRQLRVVIRRCNLDDVGAGWYGGVQW